MKPYQRKSDNRWVQEIKLENGEKKVVYGKTEKEVTEKADEIKFQIRTGQYMAESKDTLIWFLKEYHKVRAGYDAWNPKSIRPNKAKWEQTTAELFKMYIDVHFEPYFKDMRLKDIKPMTLDKFYNFKLSNEREVKFKQGKTETTKKVKLSNNTVIKLHKFLKAAFNYAVINDKIRKNPTDGVELAPKEKYEPVIYSEEQFLKLLDYVDGKDDEVPIILGAGCGLRRGEILGLRWSDIDFKNCTITVSRSEVSFTVDIIEKNPKNETSKRTFAAPAYVINTLKWHYEKNGKPDKNQNIVTRWKPKSLSDRFNWLLKHFDMPHIRLHDLRHYNAVIMLRENIQDKVAAERLGHSTVSTLREVYQHVLKDMDEAAAEKINNSIKPKEKAQTMDKPLTKEERKAMFKVV
jgi:integrase